MHISANRWHTVKSVILRAEDEEGEYLFVRVVRSVLVGEARKILFERKFNIIS